MSLALFIVGFMFGLLSEQAIARRHRRRAARLSLRFRIGPVSDVRPSRPFPKE